MNKITKNIAICGLVAGAGMLTSCEDFLTIKPSNSIVEEAYWQDKNDLNNSVTNCYKRLVDGDNLAKYIYWGELRADNLDRAAQVSASGEIASVINASLLPTYGMFDWTPMYNVINNCNKVLAHGEEVVENDQSFSNADWTPIRAEVITLRAFAHFWLVRTFGEVPYVTVDYNNDHQDLLMPQSTQLTVLNNIIEDLESVKDQAMNDYGNVILNKGRITKKAVYALLADVYLWRASYKAGNCHPFTKLGISSDYIGERKNGEMVTEDYGTSAQSDYQKCIECCDKVISIATKEKIDYMNKTGQNIGGGDIEILPEDLLCQNVSTSTTPGISIITNSSAYTQIFGDGNSDESIFELQTDGITYGNGIVSSLIWNFDKNTVGTLVGATSMLEGSMTNPNTTDPQAIFTKTDYRLWENFQYEGVGQTSYPIGKHYFDRISQSNGMTTMLTSNEPSTGLTITKTSRTKDNVDANWIVYRMSEIYLMKAEAMSQVYADEANLQTAFNYVRDVFKRSNPYAYAANNSNAGTDSLKFETFSTQEGIERLVMAERQREFIMEGKRWFDLVRFAQRRGNTKEMLAILTRKFATNRKAIESKLAHIQSLFSPVKNSEIKSNHMLYQNGVWSTNESTSKTDNM